ncbi:MAG: inositol monophosphatase family protein [Clostridia bacterium]
MDNNELLVKIRNIVSECGSIILNADEDSLKIESKEGNNNIVTNYDKLIQNILKEKLLKFVPGAVFIGEENDEQYINNIEKDKYKFIVDPIDGTTNFSRKLNTSSISVALLKNDTPIIAVCYNPYVNEMYTAIKGYGAFLNGKKIHVSNKELKDGILLSGYASYYNELRSKSLDIHNKLSLIAGDFRRYGSAVIEMCSIASGKAELYYELKLMPWDYAAASLIIKEAGGKITTIDGKEIQYNNPSTVLASNGVEDYTKYI